MRGWRPCARLARAACSPTARASVVAPAELKNCRSPAAEVRGRLAFSARATCAPTARASAVPPAELTNCRWRAGEVHGRRTLYTHTHPYSFLCVLRNLCFLSPLSRYIGLSSKHSMFSMIFQNRLKKLCPETVFLRCFIVNTMGTHKCRRHLARVRGRSAWLAPMRGVGARACAVGVRGWRPCAGLARARVHGRSAWLAPMRKVGARSLLADRPRKRGRACGT